jgi:hypothetical protein
MNHSTSPQFCLEREARKHELIKHGHQSEIDKVLICGVACSPTCC